MPDVLVTPYAPTRGSGRGLRTCGVITAMARRRPLVVAYVPYGGEQPPEDLREHPEVELRELTPSRGARRAGACAGALARGVPWDLARGVSPELRAATDAVGDGRLVADGPVVAAALLALARRRPVIYLAHNVESDLSGGARLRRFERSVLQTFAEAWVCTPRDAARARELGGPGVRVREVPNVVDLARVAGVSGPRPGGARVLLVADHEYAPNREALELLLGTVMPRVWEQVPGARLDVVGRGAPAVADPRVRVHGFVADLDGLYAGADAVVVALLRGGGSPLKLIEGLASGVPVVATRHAAELVGARDGEHLLVADDAAALADALVTVLTGAGPDGLGARGRGFVAERLSVDALEPLVA